MLIVFPLGLLATSLIFDIFSLATGEGRWSAVSEYMIAAGVVGGLLAAIFGLIDWLAIPNGTRAKAIGLWHGLGNVVVVLLFLINWFLRLPAPATPPAAAIVLSFLAIGLALVTGWLGGELVGRLGIGVDDNANVNAPSSLSTNSVPRDTFTGPGRRAA
jgi:uncharacterized membrane protein